MSSGIHITREFETFEAWWSAFCAAAVGAGFEINQENPESYREFYDDGDSPRECLATEMSYAIGDDA